jgi:hypothetical protein
MITILCRFRQFSAKNWRSSQKPFNDDVFAQFSFVPSQNRQKIFGENI